MKNMLLIATIALFAAPSFANTLTCTLQSGHKKDTIAVDLSQDLDQQAPYGKGIGDLSLSMTASCKGTKCTASVVVSSQKVEDEVGEFSFDFKKNGIGLVHNEPIHGSEDGRKYVAYCYVNQK